MPDDYYRIHRDETVTEAVRRVAGRLVAHALEDLDHDDPHEGVHEVRKRCKEVRALVRIVRGAQPDLHDRWNPYFRDTARLVSDLRDAHSDVESVDDLRALAEADVDLAPVDEVRGALVERRDAMAERDMAAALRAVRERLEQAGEQVTEWTVEADEWDALRGGVALTYGRFRARLDDAAGSPTSHVWHEWRKRVKYHRYHCQLLRGMFEGVVQARIDAIDALSDLIGDDNDRWELRNVLRADPDRYGGQAVVELTVGLLDRQRARLQARALPLGRLLAAEEPDALVERFGVYWRTWREEGRWDDPAAVPDNVIPVGD